MIKYQIFKIKSLKAHYVSCFLFLLTSHSVFIKEWKECTQTMSLSPKAKREVNKMKVKMKTYFNSMYYVYILSVHGVDKIEF